MMSKHILTLVFCIISIISVLGQKNDYVWLLGSKEHTTLIDFNNNIDYSEVVGDIDFYFTLSNICNDDGALQFATNGCYVIDQDLKFMDDDEGEMIAEDYKCTAKNWPDIGYGIGWSQGAISLPLPGSDSLYYIFTILSESINDPNFEVYASGVQYTIINKSKREGKGEVISKYNQIIDDRVYFEGLSASHHANGEDWWILQMSEDTNRFYKILFTELGVEKIDTQYIGIPHNLVSVGGCTFSPDGSHYVRFMPGDGLYAYDFDNTSGELSNFRHVTFPDTAFAGGCAFSPNSRYLYITAYDKLYQVDFWQDDLQAATVLVAERDKSLGDPPFIVNFYQPALAPDCKIYITPTFGFSIFSVIHAPNEPAEFCDFRQYSFDVKSQISAGIPNFPHFRGLTDEVCDPTIVPTIYQIKAPNAYRFYPVPVRDYLTIEYLQEEQVRHRLSIYAIDGSRVIDQALESSPEQYIDLTGLSSGMYFVRISDEAHRLVQEAKIIKVE